MKPASEFPTVVFSYKCILLDGFKNYCENALWKQEQGNNRLRNVMNAIGKIVLCTYIMVCKIKYLLTRYLGTVVQPSQRHICILLQM